MKKKHIPQRLMSMAILFAMQWTTMHAQVSIMNDHTGHTKEQQISNKISSRATELDSPGGISDKLRLWLRADRDVDYDPITKNVSIWKDNGPFGFDFNYNDWKLGGGSQSNKTNPVYMDYEEKMNFNPSINFSRYAFLGRNTGVMSEDAPEYYTSFVVYFSVPHASQNNTRVYLYSFAKLDGQGLVPSYGGDDTRNPAAGFNPRKTGGRVRYRGDAAEFDAGAGDYYVPNSTALEMITLKKANGSARSASVLFDFGNGEAYATSGISSSSFGTRSTMKSEGTIIGGASLSNGFYNGLMSDVIFYEKALTVNERNKVKTYLAIKYGITLDDDSNSSTINFDYILSSGTNVWAGNSLPNNAYHHNVAGIVRDDASLFINKSKSTTGEGIVGMMPQGHKETGQGTESDKIFIKDESGLFWGDDAGQDVVTYTKNGEDCFDFEVRTSRVWLVQKTNMDKAPVTIFLGQAGGTGTDAGKYDNYMNNRFQAYLIIAKSKEDFENKTWDMVIPGYFDPKDKYHKFNYTFTEKETYFSLAFKQLPGGCESCTFKGEDEFTFTSKNLGGKQASIKGGKSLTLTNLATSKNQLQISSIKFEAGKDVSRMRIRPNGNRKAVNISSSGGKDEGGKCTITYTLSMPANATFAIGDIDNREIASVHAYCNNVIVYPQNVYREPLTGSKKRKGYSFTYKGSTGTGIGKQSVGRGNPQGILHFDFGMAIEQVVITYTSTNGGTRYLDLFPIQFSCPQPPPEPNEAGYAMQKQGSTNVNTCDIVDYKFTLVNANPGCDSSRVHFEDILPAHMKWLRNTLSFNGELLDTKIEEKGGESLIFEGTKLVIDSLKLPGSGAQTILRAQAIFEDDAPINTTYFNQSSIDYLRNDNKQSENLLSTDAYFIQGIDTDKRTPTIVDNDARDYKYLTANLSYLPSSCYRENNEIIVTIKINNANIAIPQTYLDLDYNENFHYVKGSFTLNGANLSSSGATEMIEVDEDGESMLGLTTVSGFTLQPGENTLTYTVKVPPKTDLIFETDPVTGKDIYDDFAFEFDLNTEAEGGVCLDNAFLFTNGDAELPYCASRKYIITNKNVTTVITK